jgi:hypothetical protein
MVLQLVVPYVLIEVFRIARVNVQESNFARKPFKVCEDAVLSLSESFGINVRILDLDLVSLFLYTSNNMSRKNNFHNSLGFVLSIQNVSVSRIS